MALLKCEDCGGNVSSKAPACPHCGCPIDRDSILASQGEAVERVAPSPKKDERIDKTSPAPPVSVGPTIDAVEQKKAEWFPPSWSEDKKQAFKKKRKFEGMVVALAIGSGILCALLFFDYIFDWSWVAEENTTKNRFGLTLSTTYTYFGLITVGFPPPGPLMAMCGIFAGMLAHSKQWK